MGEEEEVTTTSLGDQEELKQNTATLHHVIILISSLISLSYTINVFGTKWQFIRSRLEELLRSLKALENCESTDSFSLSIKLESILYTLKNCDELAKKCLELSYTGKLRMQSDLDMLCSRLDCHIESLADIYSMGLLTQRYAIVVSRPGVTASRDDLRFYVEDLLSRFKIGCNNMKKQALIAYNEAVLEDGRYVKIALEEVDGFLGFLVKFLDAKDGEIQEEAVKAVYFITGIEPYKSVMINAAGVISPLIRVLESGNELSKEFACKCLMKITENFDNAWSVSSHGGITALSKICSTCDDISNIELVSLACGVLKNLAGVEEIKRFMVEEGVVGMLINLAIRSKDELVQLSSLDLLQTMAYKDEAIQKTMLQEGVIHSLVRIINPSKALVTLKVREMAFEGIANTCSDKYSLKLLIDYGFMDHILYFIVNGDVTFQEFALKASFWLCEASEESKRLMGEEGFMPVLVRLIDSKSFEIRETAARTLSNMMLHPKNRRKFVQDDRNVGFLLQLLDRAETNQSEAYKALVSILKSLANSSNSARKQIVKNLGYLKKIEKLDEVSDAKKIVWKLSSKRFGSILTGFWHS